MDSYHPHLAGLSRNELEDFAVRAAVQLRMERNDREKDRQLASVLTGFAIGTVIVALGFALGTAFS